MSVYVKAPSHENGEWCYSFSWIFDAWKQLTLYIFHWSHGSLNSTIFCNLIILVVENDFFTSFIVEVEANVLAHVLVCYFSVINFNLSHCISILPWRWVKFWYYFLHFTSVNSYGSYNENIMNMGCLCQFWCNSETIFYDNITYVRTRSK